MQRLVDILGATEHRVIVSKGPLAEQIRLHDNMCGEGHLPQPSILPLVDLVITHGGNNTTCEALHHGKPMVVLPIFWDQYDNAQRIARDGARRAPLDLRVRGRGADRRGRPAAGRRGAAGAARRACGASAEQVGHRRGGRPDRAARVDLVVREPDEAGRVAAHAARPRRGSASGRPPCARARTRAVPRRARRTGRSRLRPGAGCGRSARRPARRASAPRPRRRAARRPPRDGRACAAPTRPSWGRPARHRRARAGSPPRAPSPARSAVRARRAGRPA